MKTLKEVCNLVAGLALYLGLCLCDGPELQRYLDERDCEEIDEVEHHRG